MQVNQTRACKIKRQEPEFRGSLFYYTITISNDFSFHISNSNLVLYASLEMVACSIEKISTHSVCLLVRLLSKIKYNVSTQKNKKERNTPIYCMNIVRANVIFTREMGPVLPAVKFPVIKASGKKLSHCYCSQCKFPVIKASGKKLSHCYCSQCVFEGDSELALV